MGGGEGDSGGENGARTAAATVHIRCSNGNKFSVRTELDATVGAFKATVATSCDVPAEQQRLIYKGRILKDEQTLSSYGVESDHTIHLVRASPPMSSPNPTATTTANQGTATHAPNSGSSPAAPNLGASLFPGLGLNGLGSNLGGLPDLDMMQQQLSQNPNIMRDIMNTPAIQSLMNNPDLMRNIIMNNPQMRDIIDRNPDLAHILNDPSILRQTLEAARNPELMREMMRNTDRAMSNIESSPEGFNMLRRMYETVQEPFLNATTMAGEADTGSNPFAALLGNQAGNRAGTNPASNTANNGSDPAASPAPNTNPLPNPWSTTTGGGAQPGTRSIPAGETRPSPAGGAFGGASMPDLTSLLGGGMPDPSLFNQVLQNPAMMQMMQNLMSDPQTFNQLLGFNPTLRSLLDTNPQLREMIQNPEFIRQLMSPDTMQQILSLQQSLQGFAQLGGRQPSGQEQNQTGTGTVPGAGLGANANLELLRNLFGGLGAGGFGAPASQSNAPPEELYATQLTQLQEMGFIDTQENIRALIATSGNVHAAVERLLGNFGL